MSDSRAAPSTGLTAHRFPLPGCRPTPLASYLKGLGVLRIVAEQADPGIRGWWTRNVFHVESRLDRDELADFLLQHYEPTPILAPWNGGSGFYPKDNKKGIEPIGKGRAERFRTLRETIRNVEDAIRSKGMDKRPSGDEKAQFLTELRNTANEGFLTWIDAAVTPGSDGLLYPPLLGTGGNDGRLDFTNNFMQNLVALIDPETGESLEEAVPLLGEALFARPSAGLQKSAIGQFAPGAAGGPNATSGFSGASRINPWDFVLMLEGSVLFAASTSRRLEARGPAVLAFPFTVRPTGSGAGNAALEDEEPARAESWMPLWSRPSRLQEVERVLREGRIVLNRRTSRDGLDVARAVAKLGIDRGIHALQRYSYAQRFGRTYLATPLGQMRVRRNPDADLIDDLDRGQWLLRFRQLARSGAPARVSSLLRRLEDSLFSLTRPSSSHRAVQECLVVLGECQRYLAVSPAGRERCPPVPPLGDRWIEAADDGSPEFALATGLAGLHGRVIADGAAEASSATPRVVLTMAEYMAPVSEERYRRRRVWDEGLANRVVWGRGPLPRSLDRVMRRRLLDTAALDLSSPPLVGWSEVPLSAVISWITRAAWDARISALLEGLALVRRPRLSPSGGHPESAVVPAVFTLLKPFFTSRGQLTEMLRSLRVETAEIRLPTPGRIVRLLSAGRVGDAAHLGHRLLRSSGFSMPPVIPEPGDLEGPRLLGALMVPLRRRDLASLATSYFQRRSDASDPSPQHQDG